MANTKRRDSGAQVPVDHPDREAAGRNPGDDAVDRPGFDLGGARERGDKRKMRNPATDPDQSPPPTGRGEAD